MKKLIFTLILLLSFSGVAVAKNYGFVWDYDPPTDVESWMNHAGFRLYQSDIQGDYVGVMPVDIPATDRTWTLLDIVDGPHFWVVTAIGEYGGNVYESDYSNEVTNVKPGKPRNFKGWLKSVGAWLKNLIRKKNLSIQG